MNLSSKKNWFQSLLFRWVNLYRYGTAGVGGAKKSKKDKVGAVHVDST